MAIDAIISRLEKCRAIGPMKWQACCPAHADRTPSLAVRELGDGRILIHCFSGCSALDIVGALGLELSDLMPPLEEHHYAPVKRPWTGDDALRCLTHEIGVVAIVTADLMNGVAHTDADLDRLYAAAANITKATEYVNGLGR
jgi:hypothetical protein